MKVYFDTEIGKGRIEDFAFATVSDSKKLSDFFKYVLDNFDIISNSNKKEIPYGK